tara:strand:- start:118 stop:576 length:459 start_codon:yes stop_codon:yes gene_type:complete
VYLLRHRIDSRWNTQIVLPLNNTIDAKILQEKISDIHPSLLLFLQKLRGIELVIVKSTGLSMGQRNEEKDGEARDRDIDQEIDGDRWTKTTSANSSSSPSSSSSSRFDPFRAGTFKQRSFMTRTDIGSNIVAIDSDLASNKYYLVEKVLLLL